MSLQWHVVMGRVYPNTKTRPKPEGFFQTRKDPNPKNVKIPIPEPDKTRNLKISKTRWYPNTKIVEKWQCSADHDENSGIVLGHFLPDDNKKRLLIEPLQLRTKWCAQKTLFCHFFVKICVFLSGCWPAFWWQKTLCWKPIQCSKMVSFFENVIPHFSCECC